MRRVSRLSLKPFMSNGCSGTLTALRNDSVFINNIPFHYNEITTMRIERTKLNYAGDGTLLIIAGVGVLVLNTINGIYRKDDARNWFSPPDGSRQER